MQRAYLEPQVRAAEDLRRSSMAPGALMRQAAFGLAVYLRQLLQREHGTVVGRQVALLVGSGDNGGDALHAGAELAGWGIAVRAVLLSEQPHAEALDRFVAAGGRVGMPERAIDLLVDGIVGIGGRPGLRTNAQEALTQLRSAAPEAPLVAVDLPSGVDVDTGECPATHVQATHTVTFGSYQPAHLLDPAALACGEVHLVDLQLDFPVAPIVALEPSDVARLLPSPQPNDHKYTRGVLAIAAGSDRYPGAGVLATAGASAGLCGMVRFVAPSAAARAAVLANHPEVVPAPGRVQAWALGSGLDVDTQSTLQGALASAQDNDAPVVLDAAALPLVAANPQLLDGVRAVLTPHAGELAAMLHEPRELIEARTLHYARLAAVRFQAVVLLKGRRTVIAAPDGAVRVNTTGTSWLAGAGAGDVLTGIIGSLLAAGLEPMDAASVGAWLHGAAAESASASNGGGPIVAGDVARVLPALIGDTLQSIDDAVTDSIHD